MQVDWRLLTWPQLCIGALALFLIIWLWSLAWFVMHGYGPNGANFGIDFSHIYSAALAMKDGRDAYDYHVLSQVQRSVLVPLHLPVERPTPMVLVGSSPFFFWLLGPLTAFPFQISALVWITSTYVLSGLGFFFILRYFGWTQVLLPLAFFLALPQTVLAAYYGNIILVVFFGVAAALPLLRRYPVIAGFCLSLAVLKLPQATPLAFLIIIFEAPHKKRVLAGFLSMYFGRTAFAYLVLGGAPIVEYWHGLFSFSRSIDTQPNLISLSGLYVQHFSAMQRSLAGVVSIAIAGGLTVWWAWRQHGKEHSPVLDHAWLWGVWMLATPYAHFDDELLLVIPVVALLGHNARNIGKLVSIAVLYLGIGSLFLFSFSIHGMQMLWASVLAITVCFASARLRAPTMAVITAWRPADDLELESA